MSSVTRVGRFQPRVLSKVTGLSSPAHQATADANVEFEAFNACAEWCRGQAHDDGHQQEILAPAPAVYAAPAPVVEYIAPAPAIFYAAPAQVVEYLVPAPVTYAAPVAIATVGFGSLPVEPIVFR